MSYLIAVVCGYLLGSIMFAPLLASRRGVDLYETADGNPGAWNALQQLGARRAWLAFMGDGVKAAVAAAVGLALGGWWVAWAAVAAAIVGHAAPVFAHGRGGKGVMCFVGGMLVLAPLAWLICLGLCVVVALGRDFAWGARVGVFALPVAQLATGPVSQVEGTGVLMTLVGGLFLLRSHTRGHASGVGDVGQRS